MKKTCLATVLILITLSCNTAGKEITMNIPDESGEIGSMDIPVRPFFWMLQPWGEGTLVTVDGHARFSEMSFEGNSRVRIRPLINFPRQALDGLLHAYPEHGLVISKSSRMFHIADIKTGQTRSVVPRLTGKHSEKDPILLDGDAGLLLFPYVVKDPRFGTNFFVVYNYKTDETVFEFDETELNRVPIFPLDSENLIVQVFRRPLPSEIYIYNWRTGERTDNELTRKLSGLGLQIIGEVPRQNGDLKRRFCFRELFLKQNCH
jgi:hypothetical protein